MVNWHYVQLTSSCLYCSIYPNSWIHLNWMHTMVGLANDRILILHAYKVASVFYKWFCLNIIFFFNYFLYFNFIYFFRLGRIHLMLRVISFAYPLHAIKKSRTTCKRPWKLVTHRVQKPFCKICIHRWNLTIKYPRIVSKLKFFFVRHENSEGNEKRMNKNTLKIIIIIYVRNTVLIFLNKTKTNQKQKWYLILAPLLTLHVTVVLINGIESQQGTVASKATNKSWRKNRQRTKEISETLINTRTHSRNNRFHAVAHHPHYSIYY